MSPSTASGESSVAWKVWPGWLRSESIVSTSRTAMVVPEGIVTFCGGGGPVGGGGVRLIGADGADEAIVVVVTSFMLLSLGGGVLCGRETCLGLGDGFGAGASVSRAGAAGAETAVTCKLLII